MSATAETRFAGCCFRCGGYGHWADDPQCPWLRKAASPREHRARIASITMRFLESPMTPEWRHRKTEYIRQENAIWGVKA